MDNWTLFIPIYNLELTKAIHREIKIDRVTFVETEKIPFIRKRLNILNSKNELFIGSNLPFNDGKVFQESDCMAMLKIRWDGHRKFHDEYSLLQDAINFLASSQMIYMKRNQFISFGGPTNSAFQLKRYKLVKDNETRNNIFSGWHRITPIESFRLDALWKKRTRVSFFDPLLSIYKESGVNKVCLLCRARHNRQTFAVSRLLDWYKNGYDVQRLLPHLSTYLGHLDISSTQRYLKMIPELLHEAGNLFERYALSEATHVK